MPIISVTPTKDFSEAYLVPSNTIHKATHLVAQDFLGNWVCSCPHFMFRNPANGCKHIERVKTWRKDNQPIPVLLPAKITRFSAMDV